MTAIAFAEIPHSFDDLLDDELRGLVGAVPAAIWERVLVGPARDVLSKPGKQFRANLVDTAWRLSGGAAEGPPLALRAAIEILHAGSLVIDDIEDDAELRRGLPALHRRYGVPLAINTGNWLYFLALKLIDRASLSPSIRGELHRVVLQGVLECHSGQALDLGHDVTSVARSELRTLVHCTTAKKAGALTQLATELGASAAGAEPARQQVVGQFGAALGVGLQMLDDLSSVTSGWRIDKSREDLWQLRPTWAWVWAAEAADDASWMRLHRWARQVAKRRDNPEPLARFLGLLATRRGTGEVSKQLATARAIVEPVGDLRTLEFIDAELARLESSYV